MPALSKATLQEISADSTAAPVPGTELELQFNPQSLKLALANQVEGGDSVARQKRQYLGKTSTTLSFDLVFDTADQGTTDAPVSVRTQTAMVERFVLPKGQGNDKQAPPKCRFSWNELVIDGIIEDVSIDFDLFAANGTPLRARMGVSIKEQDAKYELLQTGPGANNANGATAPGRPGTGPGSLGGRPTDRSAQALGGESAADFAVRVGLDPSAWRGIAGQLGGGASLSLTAGATIGFSASLSASAGIGVAAGVDVGASLSVASAFGLGGSSAADPTAGGFALAAAGGLGAALASVAIVGSSAASARARRAFGNAVPQAAVATAAAVGLPSRGTASLPAASAAALTQATDLPPPAASIRPALPDQARAPLLRAGPSLLATQSPPPAPPPPLADARATGFGLGVPLRPRVGSAADLRADAAAGRIALRPRGAATDALAGSDPSAPPWTKLPASGGRRAADRAQARRSPRRPCGCNGK